MLIAHLMSKVAHTSIPFELACGTASETDHQVRVFSFSEITASGHAIAELNDMEVSRLPRSMFGLRRLLTGLDVDVLHLHHPVSAALASVLKPLRGSYVVVKTEHNDRSQIGVARRLLSSSVFPFIDGLIANSQATMNSLSLAERAILNSRRKVIYNGVQCRSVRNFSESSENGGWLNQKFGYSTNAPLILNVGRCVDQKNQRVLIAALALLKRRGLRANLLIVGDGPLRRDLEAYSEALGVSEQFKVSGFISRDDVYKTLGKSSVFSMPSLFEGFCNAAVEALCAGVPAVLSDLPVLREVAGTHASFVSDNAPDAWASAIEQVINQPQSVSANKANRAANYVRNKYDMSVTVARHVEFYDELLRSQNGASR